MTSIATIDGGSATSITFTNGSDYIYFGQKKDDGKEPVNI